MSEQALTEPEHDAATEIVDKLDKYYRGTVANVDKWILTLSSAALAFTIGPAGTLAVAGTVAMRAAMATSVLGFTTAVLAAMVAKGLAYLNARRMIRDYMQSLRTGATYSGQGKYDAAIHVSNVVAFSTFLAGLLALAAFGALRFV